MKTQRTDDPRGADARPMSNEEALDAVLSTSKSSKDRGDERIDGVVIGVVEEVASDGEVLVDYPGSPGGTSRPAVSTVALTVDDVGRSIALSFQQGDPDRPVVLGLIRAPAPHLPDAFAENATSEESGAMDVSVDGETLTLSAARQIVLRCGKASITLTRAGKILIRGAYLLSRSSGANRIKGGSIQLN